MRKARPHIAVALDGPAASGKSSVAKQIAEKFGFTFVNSGAMYRAFTWHVLQSGIDPDDQPAVVRLLDATEFTCGIKAGASTIAVNGTDPGAELSSTEVNQAVSPVASIPEVRSRLVMEQRRYLEISDVVMEGRDIGTVVFPDTECKFYVHASPEVRAQRRAAQGIVDDIGARDRQDSNRKASPLRPAEDAERIDTSYLNIDQVVERISQLMLARGVTPRRPEFPRPHSMGFWYWLFYSIAKGLFTLVYRRNIINPEKLNVPGGCFIASNHVSFFDPPLVGTCFNEAVYYVARKSLFRSVAAWLYPKLKAIPLDQNRPELSTMRTIINLTKKEGQKMVIFPEGERSPTGEILPGQRGVGMLISKARVPVLPMRLFGPYEIFPIGQSAPSLTGKITVVVGDPIYFTEEELNQRSKEGYRALSQRVMDEIAKLQLPEEG